MKDPKPNELSLNSDGIEVKPVCFTGKPLSYSKT